MSVGIYVSLHAYSAFAVKFSNRAAVLMTLIVFALSQFFWVNFFLRFRYGIRLPVEVMNACYIIFAFFGILAMVFIVLDVLWLTGIRFENHARQAVFAAALAGILMVYGMINAHITRFSTHEIAVDKPGINAKVVFLSDTHIGNSSVTMRRMQRAVNDINALQPDLVIFGGDIFDNVVTPFVAKYAPVFNQLSPKHGVFAILGNHEYYGEGVEQAVQAFQDWGFTVLRDEKVRIPQLNLTLVGLDDPGRFTGNETKKSILTKDLTPGDLQVVAVHRPTPRNADVAELYGNVDAVLAGHSHNGQMFPINLIVRRMFKNAWGAAKFGDTWLITTSGLGLWGPQVRIGSRSEIMVLNFTSKNK